MIGDGIIKAKYTCQKCGSDNLVYEELYQYGMMHKVLKNGKIAKRAKKVDYGGDGDNMLYCHDCGHSIDYRDFNIVDGYLELNIKNHSEYYNFGDDNDASEDY